VHPDPRRGVRLLVVCLVAAVLLYTVHRAVVLRVEYWDGYESLMNARALAGDRAVRYGPARPPWLALVQVPAVAITSAGTPASVSRLVVPHLVSALLSLLTAGAVFRLYREAFGTTPAALGALLFVGTPLFVRYGAHTMSDVPSAGWAAVTVALYLRARARGTLRPYTSCGLALGCAVLTRYQLVALGAALAAAEGGYALQERRVDVRRWLGLAVCAGMAAVLVLTVHGAVAALLYAGDVKRYLAELRSVLTFTDAFARLHHESWHDYLGMVPMTVTVPVMLLAGIGLLSAVGAPSAFDLPFLAWLLAVGTTIVLLTAHNEARYLVPVMPALVYFSVRGVQSLVASRRLGRAGALLGAALVSWALAHGLSQAVHDRDPVFRADVERRAAEALLRSRGPGGRLLFMGALAHTLHTRDPARVPGDEFFDTFHYAPFAVQYFTDERLLRIGSAMDDRNTTTTELLDGDAILKAADTFFETGTLPPGGVPPLEVWRVHLASFRRAPDGRFTPAEDKGISLRADEAGKVHATAKEDAGTWDVLARDQPDGRPRPLGRLAVGPADGPPLDPGPQASLVELVQLERTF